MQSSTSGLISKFDAGYPIHEYGLAVSPDGHYLVSGGTPDTPRRNSATVSLWRSEGGAPIQELKSDGIFTACDWSPDDRTIATARLAATRDEPRLLSRRPTTNYSSEIRLIDAATLRVRSTIAPPAFLVRCLQFSASGALLALGGMRSGNAGSDQESGRVAVMRLGDRKILLDVAHGEDADSVLFIPGGNWLATGAGSTVGTGWGNQTVRLWDIRDGHQVSELLRPHGDAPCRIAVSPDGKLLASGDGPEGNVLIWDAATSRRIATIATDSGTVYSVAFSPNGVLLAAGSRGGLVRVWSVSTGQLLRTFAGHTAPVHSVAFAPDGKRLFSGETRAYSGLICVWDVALLK